MSLPVVIVVAAAENGVIGRDNQLIWRLKTDLRHFRELTLGRPLIMGRKTFQSIGKPLPGRETIVLTRDPAFRHEGVAVAHTMDAALARGQDIGLRMGADSVVVAGGAQVYALRHAASEPHSSHPRPREPRWRRGARSHRHGAIPADAVRGASGWP